MLEEEKMKIKDIFINNEHHMLYDSIQMHAKDK